MPYMCIKIYYFEFYRQKAPRMTLKRKKRLKTSVQTDSTYNEDKKSKNKQLRKHKRKSQKSANITVNKFQGKIITIIHLLAKIMTVLKFCSCITYVHILFVPKKE